MLFTTAAVAVALAGLPVTVDKVAEDQAGLPVAMVEVHTPTTPFPYFPALGLTLAEGQRITLAEAHALAVALEEVRHGSR